MRYRAFLSYSHADEAPVAALHRRLEQFRIPKAIVTQAALPSDRVRPIFRDREELSAASSLPAVLQQAIADSEYLIVACSPNSASSQWVNTETEHFIATHGVDRVLAVIVSGRDGERLFPDALRFELNAEGTSDPSRPREVLAADFRDQGDGPQAATLKLLATIIGVRYDELAQREQQAKQRRLRNIALATTAGMVLTLGLALFALKQRDIAQEQRVLAVEQQQRAERQATRAERVVEFLTDIFKVSDPMTENPEDISALEILDRGRQRLDSQLDDQPDIRAALLGTVGDVYNQLGKHQRAEQTYQAALAEAITEPLQRAEWSVALAETKWRLSKLAEVAPLLEQAVNLASSADTDDVGLIDARVAASRAGLQLQQDKAQQARIGLEFALAEHIRLTGPSSIDTAKIKSRLSNVARRFGNFEYAKELLDDAVAVFQREHGNAHSQTAALIQNRASLHLEMGQLDLAWTDIQQALPWLEKILGNDHTTVAVARYTQGRIAYALGDDRAADYFGLALDKVDELFGPEHGFKVVLLADAATAYARIGQAKLAHSMLDDASAIAMKLYRPDHWRHAYMLIHRAIIFGELGDRAEAQVYCKQGIAALEALPQVDKADLELAHNDCTPWL